ncbi:MAG: diaminopimelate epimerase [Candidatus Altiarchaeota archaeon]
MRVLFTKMQGTGNDFVLVDEWESEVIPGDRKPGFVAAVSDRHMGVGSDGVIFVQKSEAEDARFVFYNPDGSIAEMCGNGIRCFAKYLHKKGYVTETSISVETLSGARKLKLTLFNEDVEQVRVDMGAPQVKRGEAQVAGNPEDSFVDQEVSVNGGSYRLTAVGMGNPHAILFVDDVDSFDVYGVGKKIRNYVKVFPKGVNVHFVQKEDKNEFRIRTFERGVEDETLACGTGICAAGVAALLNGNADPRRAVKFNAPGGSLSVEFERDGDEISRVFLIGPAVEVFYGTFYYNP